MKHSVKTVITTIPKTFEDSCEELLNADYKLQSTNCQIKDYGQVWVAIFIKEVDDSEPIPDEYKL